MTLLEPTEVRTDQSKTLTACIFDVAGVLLASPHEQAWRETLVSLVEPSRFTTEMYQGQVAGKSRLAGDRSALDALGVKDAAGQTTGYAERKQKRMEELIAVGTVSAFPDALPSFRTVRAMGWRVAVASFSKHATGMMRSIRFDSGDGRLEIFDVNVCGRDLRHGKPDPEIFLRAASALHIEPAQCLVVEDAPAGVAAARASHLAALGVALHGDAAVRRAAEADLVATNLDDVAIDALAHGRFRGRPT